jgi:hypothetical protein
MRVTSHLRHGFKNAPVKKSLPLPLVDADIVKNWRVLDGAS